jgi:hypothetical protein
MVTITLLSKKCDFSLNLSSKSVPRDYLFSLTLLILNIQITLKSL